MAASLPLPIEIARKVREARTAAILTQAELAELLGVSERTIQNWEYGESFPRPAHLRALNAFLARDGEVA